MVDEGDPNAKWEKRKLTIAVWNALALMLCDLALAANVALAIVGDCPSWHYRVAYLGAAVIAGVPVAIERCQRNMEA